MGSMTPTRRLSGDNVAAWLNCWLRDPDPSVRCAVMRAVVRLPLEPESWVVAGRMVYTALRDALMPPTEDASPPELPLAEVIDAAGFVPVHQVREALRKIACGENPLAAHLAAHVLARVGDATGIERLIVQLDEPEPSGRYQAAKDLFRLREAAAAFPEELRRVFQRESEGSTRLWLALVLAQEDGGASLQEVFRLAEARAVDLQEFFRNPDEFASAGRLPEAAAPVLERLSQDASLEPGLRNLADDLLRQTRPEGSPLEVVGSAASIPLAQREARASELERLMTELIRSAQGGEASGRLMALDHELAVKLNELRGVWVPEVRRWFGHYRHLAQAMGPRLHVAWAISRAPLAEVVRELGSVLGSGDATERLAAAELLEQALRYRSQHGAPYFGGGSGPAEVPSATPVMIDFLEFGLTAWGAPPGYVGGTDPWEQSGAMATAEPPDEAEAAASGLMAEAATRSGPRVVPSAAGEGAGGATPATASPEPVQLGASAPAQVRPGETFVAAFAAYVPEQAEQVRQDLQRRSRRAEPQLGLKTCRWSRGTLVRIVPTGQHLEFDPPGDEFVWEGGRNVCAFEVRAAAAAPQGFTVLKFNLYIAEVRVALVPLELEITLAPGAAESKQVTAEPARTAFASYASADRLRVLERVSEIRNTAGIEIFQDCLDLRPGEQWKPALEREIAARDLFFLFWSTSARASHGWIGSGGWPCGRKASRPSHSAPCKHPRKHRPLPNSPPSTSTTPW